MKIKKTILIFFLALIIFPSLAFAQNQDLLSPEELLWLKSRNNTIVVYPEKNFIPFSFENSSGNPQGLSIDFIEMIAKKLGIKIEYLPARPLNQILDNVKNEKKADVVTSVVDTKERQEFLYFTDSYIRVDVVILARKDISVGSNLTLKDLSGKKVAIGNQYAVEEFVRTNYPRVIVEEVVDDELGLQQLVLGEVEFAIVDIASLSHFFSKQTLSSVKIV